MKEVNADLFKIMTENECHLYMKNKTVIAWVPINFHDLTNFIYAVGADWFSEGGIDVKLLDCYVAIDLNEIIEGEGHLLSSYETIR